MANDGSEANKLDSTSFKVACHASGPYAVNKTWHNRMREERLTLDITRLRRPRPVTASFLLYRFHTIVSTISVEPAQVNDAVPRSKNVAPSLARFPVLDK